MIVDKTLAFYLNTINYTYVITSKITSYITEIVKTIP